MMISFIITFNWHDSVSSAAWKWYIPKRSECLRNRACFVTMNISVASVTIQADSVMETQNMWLTVQCNVPLLTACRRTLQSEYVSCYRRLAFCPKRRNNFRIWTNTLFFVRGQYFFRNLKEYITQNRLVLPFKITRTRSIVFGRSCGLERTYLLKRTEYSVFFKSLHTALFTKFKLWSSQKYLELILFFLFWIFSCYLPQIISFFSLQPWFWLLSADPSFIFAIVCVLISNRHLIGPPTLHVYAFLFIFLLNIAWFRIQNLLYISCFHLLL